MSEKINKVTVRFNQQQLQLLDNLKRCNKFGTTHEEVICNAFRRYVEQTLDGSQL